MMSVNSARQLCKMFFSLHVVFLSVAMVESSASNGNQEGKNGKNDLTVYLNSISH